MKGKSDMADKSSLRGKQLSLEDVHYSVNGSPVLRGVSLSFEPGRF